MNFLGIVVSYIYIGLIIIFAKVFEKKGKEASRKFIHIMLGNWWFIAMYFFTNVWSSIFVPITFVIINFISYKRDLIKVMERDEQDGLGTVYYAVALLILVIISFGIYKKPILGLVPNLIMAYGDGFAAVFGKLIKSKEYKVGNTTKSFTGSFTMFIISFIILLGYLVFEYILNYQVLVLSFFISIIITIIEAISIKGIDNISVPLGMMALLILIV